MPQSLTLLPQTGDFEIKGCPITVRDHRVVSNDGLIGEIMYYVNCPDFDGQILYEFEKQGFSFEMAIECCIRELEEDAETFADMISGHYNIVDIRHVYIGRRNWIAFSKSVAGRTIADQLVEKIRSCENWGELYDEMQRGSKFGKEISNKITVEFKRQCHRV